MSCLLQKGKVLPWFWKQVLLEWIKFNYKPPQHCSMDMPLLANSAIPSIYVFDIALMGKYKAKGVITIKQFLNYRGKSLPHYRLLEKAIYCTWPFLEFVSSVQGLDLVQPISMRAIHKYIGNLNDIQPCNIWKAWATDTLCLTLAQSWARICNIRTQFVFMKMQSFYWHFINRALCTNKQLHKFKLIQYPTCTFCAEEVESFIHLFWDCEVVAILFCQLIQWCKQYVDPLACYDMSNCLILGFESSALNNIFLIAKYYIFTQ